MSKRRVKEAFKRQASKGQQSAHSAGYTVLVGAVPAVVAPYKRKK